MNVKCLDDSLIESLSCDFWATKYDDIYSDIENGVSPELSIKNRYEEFKDYCIEEDPSLYDAMKLVEQDTSGEWKTKLIERLVKESELYEINIEPVALGNEMFPETIDDVNNEKSDSLALRINMSSIFRENNDTEVDIEEREMYGSLTALKLMKDTLLNDMVYNNIIKKDGKIVNPKNYRLNLFAMKMNLLKNILDAIHDDKFVYAQRIKQKEGSSVVYTKSRIENYVNSMLDIINNKNISSDEKVNKIAENIDVLEIKGIYEMFSNSYPLIDIQTLSAKLISNDPEDAVFLKAYNSLFILRNINTIMSDSFKLFDVSAISKDYVTLDYIAMSDNFSNIIKGWQEENEERGAFEEMNNIAKFLINANYRYRDGVKTDMRLGADLFNYTVGILNKLINNIIPGTTISEPSDFGTSENISLINLFLMIDENVGFNRILEMVGNKYVYNGNEMLFEDILVDIYNKGNNPMTSEEKMAFKDGLFSIKKAFSGEDGLFNACRECSVNMSLPNYFNYIVQYSSMVSRNEYVSLSTDKDNNIVLNNMTMNNINLAKRRVESSINNSKNFMINDFENLEKLELGNENFSKNIKFQNIQAIDENGNPIKNRMFSVPVAIYDNMNILGVKKTVMYNFSKGKAYIINDTNESTIIEVIRATNLNENTDNVLSIEKFIDDMDDSQFSDENMMIFRKQMKAVTKQDFDTNNRLYDSFSKHFVSFSDEDTVDNKKMAKSSYISMMNILSLSYMNKAIKESQEGIDNEINIRNSRELNTKLYGDNELITDANTGITYSYVGIANNKSGSKYTNKDSYSLGLMAITSNDEDFIKYIVDSISYMENMIARDTVKNKANDQLPISGLRRFLNVEGKQFRELREDKDAPMSLNPIVMSTMEFKEMMEMSIDRDLNYEKKKDDADDTFIKMLEGIKNKLNFPSNGSIYMGSSLIRESDIGGTIKKHSKFNIEECFEMEFFVNYLNYLSSESKSVPFTLSINSDKSTNNFVNMNSSFVKFLSKLNNEELDYVISNIVYRMYKKRYDNITEDLNHVSEFINDIKLSENIEDIYNSYWMTDFDRHVLTALKTVDINGLDNVPFSKNDYDSNFMSANTMLNRMKLSDDVIASSNPELVVSSIVKIMNKINGTNIRIIDSTHIANVKGKFEITNNPILVGRLARYDMEGKFQNILTSFAGSQYSKAILNCEKDNFFDIVNMNLMYYIINNDIRLHTTNENGHQINIKSVTDRVNGENEFFDEHGMSYMIIGYNGNEYKIKSLQDFRSFIADAFGESLRSEGYNVTEYIDNVLSSSDEFDSFMYNVSTDGHIFYNRALMTFNKVQFILSLMYQEGTIGGSFNHPIKGIPDNLFKAESIATGSVNKRNVSLTTSTHPFELNSLDGVSDIISAACINDIKEGVSNYFGAISSVSSHDGASYLSPTATVLLNKSLYGDSASYVLKPFIHMQDHRTGSGVIVKTASFGLTNQTMRSFHNGDIMAYKTMGYKWVDSGLVDENMDIFNTYNFRAYDNQDRKIDLFTYVRDKYELYEKIDNKGNYYRIDNIKKGKNPGEYIKTVILVNSKNEEMDMKEIPIRIESNYDLWKALGGMYSASFDRNKSRFVMSENSIFATVDIMNSNMVVKDGNMTRPVLDQNEAMNISAQDSEHIQFMKHGNSDMIITEGAIKQGLFNVNRHEDFFFNREGLLSNNSLSLKYGGINLDASHQADNSHVSEMTQVMSALCSNGFTKDIAQKVYDAAAELSTKNIVKYCIDIVEYVKEKMGYENSSYNPGDESVFINDIAANFVVKTMAEKNSFTDEMREDCKALINKVKEGGFITYEELQKVLSISNPSFLNQAFPAIASYINTNSIKKQFNGTLSVMNPSKGMVSIFGNMKFGSLGVSNDEKIETLKGIQTSMDKKIINSLNMNDIMMGHRYAVYDNNGIKVNEFYLEKYTEYKNLTDMLYNNEGYTAKELVFEEVSDKFDLNSKTGILIQGSDGKLYRAAGRDLAPMNISINFGDDNAINMYDLASVRDIFVISEELDGIEKDTILAIAKNIEYGYNISEDEISELETERKDKFKDLFILGRILSSRNIAENDVIGKKAVQFYNTILKHLSKIVDYRELADIPKFSKSSNAVSDAVRYIYENMNLDDVVRQSINIDLEIIDNAKEGKLGNNDIYSIETSRGKVIPVRNGIAVDISQYEAMAPNVNKSKFGIDDDVEMWEIDEMFFFKKLLRAKLETINYDYFSYALVRGSGNHTYILDKSLYNKDKNFDIGIEVNDNDERIMIKDGKRYRVNPKTKEIMFEIPEGSKYVVVHGRNGYNDLIITDNPSDVIKSSSFYDVVVSPRVFDGGDFDGVRLSINNTFSNASSKYNKKEKVLEEKGRSAKYITEAESVMDDEVTKLDASISYAINISTNAKNDGNFAYDEVLESVSKELEMFDGNFYDTIVNGRINPVIVDIMETANEIYQSFVESCNVLAARIPSQNQQSFMSMKIALFDNSGVNNTYVNSMQQWLQGSDYDIDKVTLLMYAISGSGKFIGWSNLFDYSNLQDSFELPLPNGVETDKVNEKDINSDIVKNTYRELRDKVIKKKPDGKYRVVKSNMKSLSRFINAANIYGVILFDGDDVELNNFIKEVIDSHNMYLEEPTKRNMDAIKNYYVRNSIAVSENIKNLMESLSSVDDNKDIANASKIDTEIKKRLNESYGNIITMLMQFDDNMVGKDGIGVIASLLKNFFAIQHAFNIYNVKNINDLNDVVLGTDLNGIQINGNKYILVANYNPNRSVRKYIKFLAENADVKYKEKLEDIYNDMSLMFMKKDAAISISGLLSEAADNAKNLNLAKLNASMNTLPQIIFGITIGMDFESIIRMMVSKRTRLVDKLMRGNIFYNGGKQKNFKNIYNDIFEWDGGYYNGGLWTFETVYNTYINNSVKGGKVPSSIEYALNNSLGNTPATPTNRLNIYKTRGINEFRALLSRGGSSYTGNDEIYMYFKYFNTRFRFIPGINDSSVSNSFAGDIDSYISGFKRDMINLLPDNKYFINWVNKMADEIKYNYELNRDGGATMKFLKSLNDGANEMKQASNAVGLNKGVDQTRSKMSSFNEKVRNLIPAKARDKINTGIDFENEHDYNKYLGTKTGFSYHKYMNDNEYKSRVDNYINSNRFAFNPIKIGTMLNHVSSYISIYNTTNNVLNVGISRKNKVIEDFFDKFMFELYEGYNIPSKYSKEIASNCASFVEERVTNSFLRNVEIDGEKGFRFIIPPKFSIYMNGKLTKNDTEKSMIMTLGTSDSNMTFLKLMNEVVIPQMKEGYKVMNNNESKRIFVSDFLKSLVPIEYQSPLTGIMFNAYVINVNRASNSEFDMAKTNSFKAMANTLGNQYFSFGSPDGRFKKDIRYRITDLLYIYNSIIFNNSQSKYSMDTYFTALNSPLIAKYNEFIRNFDYESVIPDIDKIKNTYYYDKMCALLAPTINYGIDENLKYVKRLDKTDEMIVKMYKVTKIKNDDKFSRKKDEKSDDPDGYGEYDISEDIDYGMDGGYIEDELSSGFNDIEGEESYRSNNNRKGYVLDEINKGKNAFLYGSFYFNKIGENSIKDNSNEYAYNILVDGEEAIVSKKEGKLYLSRAGKEDVIIESKTVSKTIEDCLVKMEEYNNMYLEHLNTGDSISIDRRKAVINDIHKSYKEIISIFENSETQKNCK